LTGCTDTLGAITASAPNQSPVSAAGGGRSSRSVASPMARSSWGALPRSPSRSILTPPALQNAQPRLMVRAVATATSLSGLRIA
jgi:hypothetical protein